MKVTAILKGRVDSEGKRPIQIRIADGKKRNFIPTGIKVLASQWKDGKIINHPQAQLYNQHVKRWILETESRKIQGTFNRYPDADFKEYLFKCLNQWDREKSGATIQQFRTEGDKFLAWAGDLLLSRITLEKLNAYKGYLFNEGYAGNTVAKSFKNLKTIITRAVNEKVIEHDPFDLFEMPAYQDPHKDYLTRAQVDAIDAFGADPDTPEKLRHVATWFTIGCYTGLRHSDMRQFDRRRHIVNNRLVLHTVKTKDIVGQPVREKLYSLFERVEWQALRYVNQNYNEHLKVVAAACDLNVNLTAHMSRHTFAVRCADAGIGPEVTARLMGVKSLRTVAIYYKITNTRIDEEIDKIF